MIRRLAIVLPAFTLGFIILFASVLKASEVSYSFNKTSKSLITSPAQLVHIDYDLPEATTTPRSIFWPVYVLNDKVETVMAADTMQKSLILLGHSDQRLVAGIQLFKEDDINESVAVLNKAEGYLNESLNSISEFDLMEEEKVLILKKLNLASLKHREILETILIESPDDARPVITKILDTPKMVYSKTSKLLQSAGYGENENPFEE